MTVDSEFSVGQIQDLLQRFRSFSVDSLKTYQVPTVSGGSSALSYQDIVWDQAEPILDLFRGTAGGAPIGPGQVIVELPPAAKASAALVSGLEKAGFDADAVGAATSGKASTSTVIRFGPKGAAAAQLVARYLNGASTFQFQSDLPGQRVEVMPGAGLTEIRDTPVDASQIPLPTIPATGRRSTTTTSTTSPVSSATTTSTLPDTSTTVPVVTEPPTTAVGFVPTDPVAGAKCGG